MMMMMMMMKVMMMMKRPEEPDRTLVQCGSRHCQYCTGIPRTRNQTCGEALLTITIVLNMIMLMMNDIVENLQVDPSDSRLQTQTWS